MSKGTLLDKVWGMHTVAELPGGKTQLYVSKHLIHEVTSPPAFDMNEEEGINEVRRPDLNIAVEDHVMPTDDRSHPYTDHDCEIMSQTLKRNCDKYGIEYIKPKSGQHGICHIIFPEIGVITPGKFIVMGDSHTSTHGAFGAIARGIGTTQVRHVLATQTVALTKPKVVRINFEGKIPEGSTAKDLALHMIRTLGVSGGNGCAYELRGKAIEDMSMNERMTTCNMGIEGGAPIVYINPDGTTFEYLKQTPRAPKRDWDKAVKFWNSMKSDYDAVFDEVREVNLNGLEPMVTWGINPEQVIGISENVPYANDFKGNRKKNVKKALDYIGLEEGQSIAGTQIDRAFIGSCTNGRINDIEDAATILKGNKVKVPTILSYGSEKIMNYSIEFGYDSIFREAGVDVRLPGCSMCLAMNPDKLIGDERCASTSNRNFKGRQGSKTGRTHLMSPYSVASAAIHGKITDPREDLQ